MAFEPAAQLSAQSSRPVGAPVPKKADLLDYLVRAAVVQLYGRMHTMPIDIALKTLGGIYPRYKDEATKQFCVYALRGAVLPAMTYMPDWAAGLVGESASEVIQTIMPRSAFAQLAQLGLTLNFGRAGRINVPDMLPTSVAGKFVAEGEPIPVVMGDTFACTLTPKKLAVLVSYTGELDEHSIPSMEGILRARIQEGTALVMDSILLDDQPGDDLRPPGLLFGATTIPSSGAVQGDLEQVAEAVSRGYARNLILMVNPVQALSSRLGRVNVPMVVSGAVPLGTVIALDANDFVCAGGSVPRFEISKHAAIHMEDEPHPVVHGDGPLGGATASPVRSMFQTNSLSMRMVWNADWALRRPVAKVRLTQPFTVPAVGATNVADVDSLGRLKVSDRVWLEPVGYHEIDSMMD